MLVENEDCTEYFTLIDEKHPYLMTKKTRPKSAIATLGDTTAAESLPATPTSAQIITDTKIPPPSLAEQPDEKPVFSPADLSELLLGDLIPLLSEGFEVTIHEIDMIKELDGWGISRGETIQFFRAGMSPWSYRTVVSLQLCRESG